jgi:hypothetical protein
MEISEEPMSHRLIGEPKCQSEKQDSYNSEHDFSRSRRHGAALIANDGDFGGRDFETHQAMSRIEVEIDFEVGGGDAKAFV